MVDGTTARRRARGLRTELFRTPAVWDVLANVVLPPLLAAGEPVTVWSAACATGQEPYTAAMVLDELAPGGPWTVLASDVDDRYLEQARAGVYPRRHVDLALREGRLTAAQVARHLHPDPAGYRVMPRLVERVEVARLDLAGSSPWPRVDVVLLRNVLWHFDEHTRRRIVGRCADVLPPGGALVLGGADFLPVGVRADEPPPADLAARLVDPPGLSARFDESAEHSLIWRRRA